MNTCVVIPYYRHPAAIAAVLVRVQATGLPCLLVDDGSGPDDAPLLQTLAQQHARWLSLLTLPHNSGKGAAVMAGFAAAQQRGYHYALQVDADGQHSVEDIAQFLALSQQHPTAVIAGCPQYDQSVPRHRLLGRYATHIWVWINTLSFDIKDSMCGFRLYPLAPALAAWQQMRWGRRMDFDTEILVRMHWAGTPVVNLATAVRYPQDGVSHFQLWQDNLRISAMHTRLFFGLLARVFTFSFWQRRGA